uniref:Corticotropin-releasing factor domain-containing protein n=1 Tax=Neogobius melanostomus TaxID=47308 RepID=A0A8C6TB61_9GOBI
MSNVHLHQQVNTAPFLLCINVETDFIWTSPVLCKLIGEKGREQLMAVVNLSEIWKPDPCVLSRMKSRSLLLLLVFSPLAFTSSSSDPPAFLSLLDSPLSLHLLRLLHKRESPPFTVRSLTPGGDGSDGDAFRDPGLSRRNEPPLSIDLTFHLLRNMIHMAQAESQREQALLNRKVLDEVGK